MLNPKLCLAEKAALVTVLITFLLGGAMAATEQLLHEFGTTKGDGVGPLAGLVFDSAGNLYCRQFACFEETYRASRSRHALPHLTRPSIAQ